MRRAYSVPQRRVNGFKRHNCKHRKAIRECDSADTRFGPESESLRGPGSWREIVLRGEPWPALGDLDRNMHTHRVEHAVELVFPAPLGQLVQHRFQPGQGREIETPLDDLDL
jgi:hypothetical protein